jgi:hypothetical protein
MRPNYPTKLSPRRGSVPVAARNNAAPLKIERSGEFVLNGYTLRRTKAITARIRKTTNNM